MLDDDFGGMLWPRGLFETRRHARRRFEEFQARFNQRYEVTTVNGEKVATLRECPRPAVSCGQQDQGPV